MFDAAFGDRKEDRRGIRHGAENEWGAAIGLGLVVLAIHALIASEYETPKLFVKYNLAAAQYVRGELPALRLMDFSPLYFQLAVLNNKFFAGSGNALVAFQWFQTGLVAAASALLFTILRERFSRVWALAGALVFSLEKHVLIYERIFEPEICLLFLVLGCIAALQRQGRLAAGIAGFFAALALSVRPTFLPLFLAVPAFYWMRGGRGSALALRSTLFALPVLLAYSLVAAQAHRVTGDWTTPVMNPGTVFFEGNNSLSEGTSAVYPPVVAISLDPAQNQPDAAHERYRVVAQKETGRPLSIAEVNEFWAGKAFHYIADHPVRFASLLGTKALRAFHDHSWHDVKAATQLEALLPSIPGFFAALCGLAIVGCFVETKRWREGVLFYAFAAAQLAVMLIFYVSARQQVALLPSLFYFALVSGEAISQARLTRWRSMATLGFAAVLTIVFSIPNDPIREREYFAEGGLRRRRQIGRLQQLIRRAPPIARHREVVASGLAATPWAIESSLPGYVSQDHESLLTLAAAQIREREDRSFFDDFDLAVLELTAGDLDAANDRFTALAESGRVAYRTYRQSSDPVFYLGRIAALQGERERATRLLTRVLEHSPGDPFALAELAVVDDDAGAAQRLEKYFSVLDARLLLGRAYLVHGSPEKASVALGALDTEMPRIRRVMIYLAVAFGQAGEIDRGAELYRQAAAIREAPLVMSEGVGRLMRRWAALHPGEEGTQRSAARVLYTYGYFQDAMSILENMEPSSKGALEQRRRLEKAIDATRQENAGVGGGGRRAQSRNRRGQR